MGRTTVGINIRTIRLIMNNISFRTQCIKNTFRNGRCTSIWAVQSHSYIFKCTGRNRNQISDIAVSSCWEIYCSSDILSLCQRQLFQLAVNIFLNLLFYGSFHLLSVAVHNFNSVVIERIMAGGNHNTAVKILCTHHVRHAWCCCYMKKIHICTGCCKTCY